MAGILSGTRGVLVVFFGVGIAVYAISGANTGTSSNGSNASLQSAPVQVQPAPSANVAKAGSAPSADTSDAAPTSAWTYDTSNDALRNVTTYFASLVSDNKVALGFPYGESGATLTLRRKGKSLDVYINLDNGQFMCNSFSGDTIAVKFDDGKIQHFECEEAADASTNIIFIGNASRFVRELKAASRVQVEAKFFQAGFQQLSFSTTGLNW